MKSRVLFVFSIFLYHLHAQTTLTVNMPGDAASTGAGNFTSGPNQGDLRGCLNWINLNNAGPYLILFSLSGGNEMITSTTPMPILNLTGVNTVTIDGTNSGGSGVPVTFDGGGAVQWFLARQGTLNFQNLTIQNMQPT